MSIIADGLEGRCRRIARKLMTTLIEPTPATFVAREIALILDHLDIIRKRQKALETWFVEKQLYVNTQIMTLKTKPRLKDDWIEQTRLTNEFLRMLDGNEWRTTRTATEISTDIRQLQTRLLELWNMYDQLSLEDGDSKNAA